MPDDQNGSAPREQAREESGPPDPQKAAPPWWIIATLLAVAVLLIAGFGFTVRSPATVVIELLVGVASLSAGALLGFLFGIPRGHAETKKVDKGAAEPAHGATDSQGPEYAPSTNLEQVSDWLTKIIVGVGLVEMSKLRRALGAAGALVSDSIKPPIDGAGLVSQLTIIGFATIGFLATFLWTRVYYGAIQFGADSDIWALLNGLRSRINESMTNSKNAVSLASLVADGKLTQPRSNTAVPVATGQEIAAPEQPAAAPQQAAAAPEQSARPAGAPAPPSDTQREALRKVAKFKNAPAVWDSDPADDLFGDAPTQLNGRRIVGRIDVRLDEALVLTVRVERTSGGPPLKGDAIFLLHPTIQDPVRSVGCQDDKAEASFYSQGWFHVAAIVDEGRTVLKLDLREIPEVPKWFKQN